MRIAVDPFRHPIFHPGIFMPPPAEALHIFGLHRTKAPTPQIDRLMLMPRLWVACTAGVVSAPRRLITRSCSRKGALHMLPRFLEGAVIPAFSRFENRLAGRPDDGGIGHDDDILLFLRLPLHYNRKVCLLLLSLNRWKLPLASRKCESQRTVQVNEGIGRIRRSKVSTNCLESAILLAFLSFRNED